MTIDPVESAVVGEGFSSRRIADLERLLTVARRLGATVDLDEMLQAIASAATDLLDCERATVYLYDAATDELRSRLATGMADSPVSELRFPAGLGIAGQVARTGMLVNLPDAYADPRFNPDFDKTSGFRTRSMLTVRLADHDDGTVGVLQLLNKRSRPFDTRDEEIAGFLGSQAGVAMQRQTLLDHFAEKQKIQRDLNIARSIQQGLLPREQPLAAGFDIAGWNKPADETGGDFFDFFSLDDDHLSVTLADATGHGIGPALVMAEARALLRAVLLRSTSLSRAVTDVHDLLCLDMPEGRFVTAFCGILNVSTATLEFLSAGQGPILRFHAASGLIEDLPAQGLPLAFVPGVIYDQPTTVMLGAGDLLVLLTDGFYEWERADGEGFGSDRVCDLIRTHADRSATDLIAILYEEVRRFADGSRQLDDLTAVIVKRL
jgi:sigma-B regulation protein RsbU (phosphoserine phosphatase)